MVCPLRKATINNFTAVQVVFGSCYKEECAWFNKNTECCCLISIINKIS